MKLPMRFSVVQSAFIALLARNTHRG